MNITERIRTKTYFEVDYRDIEKQICETFHKEEFSAVDDLEAGNDSSHTVEVDGKVNKYDAEKLKRWQENHEPFMLRILMNELCRLGILPKGDYLIIISW